MSTINVTNLKHESSGSNNIVLDSSGNATVAGTLANTGNLTITSGNLVLSNGNGIDFSATANSSGTMSSELLDDYEEGTWTPAYAGGGGSAGTAAYSSAGYYTKTGNVVTVWGYVNVTNKGSWSGELAITGLPFTSGATTYNLGGLWITQSTIAAQTWYTPVIFPIGSQVVFAKNYNAGADAYLQITDITTSTATRFTVTYRV